MVLPSSRGAPVESLLRDNSAMADLIFIGTGTKTHFRADGNGPVRAGRGRCEITTKLIRDKDAVKPFEDGEVHSAR